MNLQERTFELLEATGLNWTVRRNQLVTKDGIEADAFGLIRNDNNFYLGTVGNIYKEYQNWQMAEHLLMATDDLDLKVTRGGQLNNGKKVYLQAELPDSFVGKSSIKRWITGLNAHDGTRAIGFGSTNTVVVCQNTFHKAYGQLSKFRHTESASDRIEEFLQGLRQAMSLDDNLIHKYKVMADQPLREEVFANVMARCFDVNINAKQSDVSSRKKNTLISVNNAITKELELEGGNLWGLFNGITRYTNHVAVKPEKSKEYVMTGAGYDTNLVAFDTIMKWIEENTTDLITVPA